MFGSLILLLAAHPDDEIVGCFAAIRRARAQGASVVVSFLTTGIPGRERFWTWQRGRYADYVERRRAEARQACAKLGIEILGFSDVPSRELVKDLPSIKTHTLERFRAMNADMVWVPAYEGGHPDHDIANFIGSTMRSETQVWEYSEYNFFGRKTRSNEFPAPNGSEVHLILSAEERFAKASALAMYASEQQNLNYVRTEEEVFRPLAKYEYSKPPHAGTIFYRRYAWASFHPKVNHVRAEDVCKAIAESR